MWDPIHTAVDKWRISLTGELPDFVLYSVLNNESTRA